MSGETNLERLLHNLSARLLPDVYVFCTIPDGQYGDLVHTSPIASFQEKEGLSLVITQQEATQNKYSYEGTFRCITLEIHSSLHAVGLTAVVSQALAEEQISANMIAGYHHDHIFVPTSLAEQALRIIENITAGVSK
jgi:hypothetical protein